jgi:hypothetical protein
VLTKALGRDLRLGSRIDRVAVGGVGRHEREASAR